jgi:hypothetical protein
LYGAPYFLFFLLPYTVPYLLTLVHFAAVEKNTYIQEESHALVETRMRLSTSVFAEEPGMASNHYNELKTACLWLIAEG